MLCGPPISFEMETIYPYLHGWPQKYMSAGMWADRILGSWTLFNLLRFGSSLFSMHNLKVIIELPAFIPNTQTSATQNSFKVHFLLKLVIFMKNT